jgi:hypothetical protein
MHTLSITLESCRNMFFSPQNITHALGKHVYVKIHTEFAMYTRLLSCAQRLSFYFLVCFLMCVSLNIFSQNTFPTNADVIPWLITARNAAMRRVQQHSRFYMFALITQKALYRNCVAIKCVLNQVDLRENSIGFQMPRSDTHSRHTWFTFFSLRNPT